MAANLIYRTATQNPPSSTQFKTSPLTHEEMDGNLKSLNNAIDYAIESIEDFPADSITLTNKTLTTPVINGGVSGTTSGKLGYNSGNITFGTGTAQKTIASNEDLAASTGASLVGYETGTLKDIADASKPLADYTALRDYTGTATTVRITSTGIAGFFTRDSDVVTADNGGTVIVDAAVRRWKRVFDGEVSVKWFGAVGDGVADDTALVQAAVNATPAGGVLLLAAAKTYKVSGVNVSGKSICIIGYGATIHSIGIGIEKTDHGNKLTVIGVAFTGVGAGIRQIAPVATTSYDELEVQSCDFNMAAGAWSMYLVGGRDPKIQQCTFRNQNSGNGVYLKDTVSPFFSTCIFKGTNYSGTAVHYPGTGNGTDAGLILRDCEILGWDTGLYVVGCDWLNITGCTIDYNTVSIVFGNQDGGNISNNYIGSLGSNPALRITYNVAGVMPDRSEKLFIINNTFTGHYEGGNDYDCILIDGLNSPDDIVIQGNSFSFYTRYGVRFSLASTNLSISSNTFSQRDGFGVAPVYNVTGVGDSGVSIKNNIFNNPTTIAAINVSAACRVNENIGCSTENRGEAVVGSGVSTFNIAHGLSYTPAKSDISLTATNAEAAARNPYINEVDATNISVGFTAITTANAGVGWRVRRYI